MMSVMSVSARHRNGHANYSKESQTDCEKKRIVGPSKLTFETRVVYLKQYVWILLLHATPSLLRPTRTVRCGAHMLDEQQKSSLTLQQPQN